MQSVGLSVGEASGGDDGLRRSDFWVSRGLWRLVKLAVVVSVTLERTLMARHGVFWA